MSLWCLSSSFGSIRLIVWEEMSFEEFQDGHWSGMILVILNLCVTVMPPIKFWINPTYGLGGNVVWRISRWPPWDIGTGWDMSPIKFQLNRIYDLEGDAVWRISRWPPWRLSWISERNDFSNSEYLCHYDASQQVLAQSDLRFGRRCYLKNFKMAAMVWKKMWFEEFQDGRHASHLG